MPYTADISFPSIKSHSIELYVDKTYFNIDADAIKLK